MARHVRLFRNGRNQTLRIPAEFELPGKEAIVRKEGDRLIVEPTRRQTLLGLLAGWEALEDELPELEDAAPEPGDL
jgi:antitoxin VapB